MKTIPDAADRFFERYVPGPGAIVMAGLKWLISDKGSAAVCIVAMLMAVVVVVIELGR